MNKKRFKELWESGDDGGGITFDDIAKCAQKWGITQRPRTMPLEDIRYLVLKAANVCDAEEFSPEIDDGSE